MLALSLLQTPKRPVEERHSGNVINGVNNEPVSQQFKPLEAGQHSKECPWFPPELTCQAQEPVLLEVPVLPRAEPVVPLQAQSFIPLSLLRQMTSSHLHQR